MRRVGHGLVWFTLLCLLSACRSAAPPLPPVPASAGPVLVRGTELPDVRDGQAVVDRVVAVVNGEAILMSELQEQVMLAQREGRSPAANPGDLERTILQRLIDHRLQIQEARRDKIEITDDDLRPVLDDFVRRNGGDRERIESQLRAQGLSWEALRREIRDQLMAERVRVRRVNRRASITEPEVDAYMVEVRPKLEAGLKVHVRHIAILAEPADAAGWERARVAMAAVVAELQGGADFAAVARERSRDSSAESGGDLGWLAPGELDPMFDEAIQGVRPGGLSAAVRSRVGYHLFRVEARESLSEQALAEARQQARDVLRQRKGQARLEEWIEDLRRRAQVSIRL